MRWEDENYVKLFTRDSLTWKSWTWQGRTVLLHLLRKVDGAGLLQCDGFDPAEAAALMLDLPREVVDVGLRDLLRTGTAEVTPGAIVLPKFIEAQESRKTEAAKKRGQRTRARDQARLQATENTQPLSRVVPECPPQSPDVPRSPPPSSALPCSALPVVVTSPDKPATPPAQNPKPPKPPRKQSDQERFFELAQDDRADHLKSLGRDVIPDVDWPVPKINKRLGPIVADWDLAGEAFAEFLLDERQGEKDPPWRLDYFVSDFGVYASRAKKRGAA